MNKYQMYVANVVLEAQGENDYMALVRTGLFGVVKQADYFLTHNGDNLWIYQVEINGSIQTAVVKRVSENGTSPHLEDDIDTLICKIENRVSELCIETCLGDDELIDKLQADLADINDAVETNDVATMQTMLNRYSTFAW